MAAVGVVFVVVMVAVGVAWSVVIVVVVGGAWYSRSSLRTMDMVGCVACAYGCIEHGKPNSECVNCERHTHSVCV